MIDPQQQQTSEDCSSLHKIHASMAVKVIAHQL